MEITTNAEISLLDQAKIQAQVLVPLLKALRAELGEERANKLVTTALREWFRDMFLRIGALTPGSPREKWEALNAAAMPRIGSDVDFELLKQDPGAMEFNITGCRYADFFRALGEPELGAVLLCEGDNHMVEVGSPEVELTRTQTIMKGAKYCDFRYRMKTGQSSKPGEA
jgi:hypothetical protein